MAEHTKRSTNDEWTKYGQQQQESLQQTTRNIQHSFLQGKSRITT